MADSIMESHHTMPSAPRLHSRTASHSSRSTPKKKSWQPRNLRPSSPQPPPDSQENLSRGVSHAHTNASSTRKRKWWRIQLFRGMINDVRRRAPFYWSDWTDAWDYRVMPATVYMYFAKYALRIEECSFSANIHCEQYAASTFVLLRMSTHLGALVPTRPRFEHPSMDLLRVVL